MNAWNRWHRYEGQSYHRADFEVTHVYYQKGSRGGVDVYASGNVEGGREWISLGPYLHYTPHDEAELGSLVPAGTTIPISLFPNLRGRARVVVFDSVPPAEGSRHTAMNILHYACSGWL